jgi:hypothetical protein
MDLGPDPKTTMLLLNKAARDNGIDPSTIDWAPYARNAAMVVMGQAGGGHGYLPGMPAAYVANAILQEAATGMHSGWQVGNVFIPRTDPDPRFAAKADIFASSAPGWTGYYDQNGKEYQATVQQAQVRDQADHDRHSGDGFWSGISDTVGGLGSMVGDAVKDPGLQAFALAALGGGAFNGLGGGALDSASLLANGGDAAFNGLGVGVSNVSGGALSDLTSTAGGAGYNLGTGAGDLTSSALENVMNAGTGNIADLGVGGLPNGSMVNLANSSQYLPINGVNIGTTGTSVGTGTGTGTTNTTGTGTGTGTTGTNTSGTTTGGYSTTGTSGVGADSTQFGTGVSTTGDEVLNTGTGVQVGGTGGAGTGGAGTALSRILAGTATADDWLQTFGRAAPGLFGALAANQRTDQLSELANQFAAYGAPSRNRYEASMTPGFDPTTIPGYSGALDTAANALQRKLSTQGNPFGNPGGQIEANKQIIAGTALPAIQNYQNQNAAAGGLSALASAYPGAATQAIGSNQGVLGGIGGAVADVFNPPKQQISLADWMKTFNTGNVIP